jgi:hypothetical protein
MKLFKYKDFINESTKEDIDSICLKYGIKNYTINSDGTIDVDGGVDLSRKNIDKLPLKFGKVTGHFYCNNNQLTSLEGCPTELGGDFDCSRNQLTSLEGCPTEVGGYFSCSGNQLTSLEGCPREVGGNFSCSYNKLVDVKGFPLIIGGFISITGNPVVEIFKLFPTDRWKEVPEHLNEYNVIRDGRKVILQALEVVYDELVIEVPDEINIEGYEII